MPESTPDPHDQPHDALFRRVFGEARHLASLLRAVLPTDLASAVELSRLSIDSASFVSDRLTRRASDVVARAPLKGGADLWVVLLCEHQSTPSRWMPLRLLEYMTRIWRRDTRAKASRLPVVVSLVIEHGPRSGIGPRSMVDLLNVDRSHPLLDFAPVFRILRLELHEAHDPIVRRENLTPLAELTLGCLARSHDSRRLATVLTDLAPVARRTRELEAADALLAIRTYIWAIIDEEDVPAFAASVDALGDDMGTAAQNLIARGREEGRAEGARRVFLPQLEQRFGPVPPDVLARVQKADCATIEAWATRIPTARHLSDVFD